MFWQDLDWYFDFVFERLAKTRPLTLSLVHALDFRNFAKDSYNLTIGAERHRSIPQSFKKLLGLLPNLRCILLDGHAEIDPSHVVTPSSAVHPGTERGQQLVMLSIPGCYTRLASTFFDSPQLRHLVYLDISGLLGSIKPLITSVAIGRHLQCLRVLKARDREIDDVMGIALFKAFQTRLWSLDISGNNLTDGVLDALRSRTFDSPSLRTESHFLAEGKLWKRPELLGADEYGDFHFIYESDWSGSFNHPERYFVDTPQYVQDSSRAQLQEYEAVRSQARCAAQLDTAEHVKDQITGGTHSSSPESTHIHSLDIAVSPVGITHLNLSGNHITCTGLQSLIRLSSGQLEHLDIESVQFQPADGNSWVGAWPKSTRLYGLLGSAPFFRPLLSSNLRSLRVHHSLVTQIPTLRLDRLSTLARWYLAETAVRERADKAFPQVFVPDMNPRITTLTLTKVPRRSSGPLVERLVRFFKLLSTQERSIYDARTTSAPFVPACVRGLRRIRLEFESDPMEDAAGLSVCEDIDAEKIMSSGDSGFSFFPTEGRSSSVTHPSHNQSPRAVQTDNGDALGASLRANGSQNSPLLNERIQKYPYSSIDTEYVPYRCTWLGVSSTVHVWVGSGVPGVVTAVNRYMQKVCEAELRCRVGPVMPTHVAAGAPEGTLIFYAAWEAMIMPPSPVLPAESHLRRMRDVLDDIKTWRRRAKAMMEAEVKAGGHPLGAPHFFWKGSLEVELMEEVEDYRSSRYWR